MKITIKHYEKTYSYRLRHRRKISFDKFMEAVKDLSKVLWS